MAIVNELITKFSFLGSITPLTNFNKLVDSSTKRLVAFTIAGEGLIAGLATFAITTANSNRSLTLLSQNTNVSIENIQTLGYAATQLGSSVDAVQSTIENLTANIADASIHGSAGFSRLGVSVREANGDLKTADQVLFEVGKSLRNMNFSKTQQQSLASSLGIDKSLIPLLNSSESSIQNLINKAKELGIVNKQSSQSMLALSNSASTLKFGLNAIKNSLAIALAPAIKDIVEKFTDFLIAHKNLIDNGIKKLVEFLVIFIDSLHRIIPIVLTMIGIFTTWRIVSAILAGTITSIFSPVYLLIGIIGSAILIIDDLIVAFDGGNSVIAKFFKNFLGIDIRPILQNLVSSFINFFHFIEDIGGKIKDIFVDIFTLNINQLGNDILNLGNEIVNFFSKIFAPIITLTKNIIDPIIQFMNKFSSFVNSKIGNFLGLSNDPNSNLNNYSQLNPVNPITNNSTNSSNVSNINQNVDIKITSNNPTEVANSINDTLQLQLNNTQMQFKKGNR